MFDRWGGAHLYSGAYVMEVSETVKDLLRPYANQSVLLEAKQVLQPINPGDGLIKKLAVLGPSVETITANFGGPALLDDLSLKAVANFSIASGPELIIELRNTGTVKRSVNMDALGPTLFAKKQGPECLLSPSDGPSFVAVTRTSIDFLQQHPAGNQCLVNGRGRTVSVWLAPGVAVPKAFDLEPGHSIDVPLRFELSEGEYEFLAGYGGGVHQARTLVSNRIAFNVSEEGKPEIVGPTDPDVLGSRTRRRGLVCGTVAWGDGRPAANARVFLWPAPLSRDDLRAANTATTDLAGEFRMEHVSEGHYIASAVRTDERGFYTAASGSEHLAGAASLALPLAQEECSMRLVLRQAATYTVRGRTISPPTNKTYSARIILTRGDAYPFERTVPIGSDGSYEFKAIPAGRYQFFAGNVGAGFEADRDINDFDIEIDWSGWK